jgi:TPR repeat protein
MFDEIYQMAKMGIKPMMIDVAYAYEFGNGVEKNKEQAIYWYKKAGDSESIDRAKALEEQED